MERAELECLLQEVEKQHRRELDLSHKGLKDDDIVLIASQVHRLVTVQSLKLAYNFISPNGAEALARILPPTLETLDLSNNWVCGNGAWALAGRLPATLRTLGLGVNHIGAAGAEALAGNLPPT